MDRKTLEYMEERVEKAKEFIANIDDLKKKISEVEHVEKIYFESFHHGVEFAVKDQDFLEEIVATFIGMAEKEIAFLEHKLAEL